MINLSLLVYIVIVVSLLLLAVVSLSKGGYKNSINRLFTAFSIFVAIWIIANHVGNDTGIAHNVALYGNYAVFFSSLAVVIVLTQFVVKLANAQMLEKVINKLLPVFWVVCTLSATPFVVSNIVEQGDVYAINFGPGVWLYGTTLFLLIGALVYGLFHGLRHNKGVRKRQIKAIAYGLSISLPMVLFLTFIIPSLSGNFAFTEFGITPLLVLVISIFYGVIRYQLFDIRQVVVRTGAYVLSLFTLSIIYYLLAYLVSITLFQIDNNSGVIINPANIVLALVLAFIFQPVKRFFDKVTNIIFYRNAYNAEDFFARFGRKLSMMTDLRTLLNYTSDEISKTLNASYGAFLVYRPEGRFAFASTNAKHKALPAEDARAIDEYIRTYGNAVILTDNLVGADKAHIHRLLVSYKIGLLLPLVQGDTIVGHLYLGEYLGSRYTARDVKTLTAVVDELMIAVQNALTVEQIKELNAHLEQRVDAATKELRRSNAQLQKLDESKDEFISMASHQLRTPLTSIKGYISMMMEGDIGKITPEQKHVLNEAFISSERMVRLISDFLNVSRLQTGKFNIEKHPVDLARLVQEEIDALAPNASARAITFVYKKPKNIPILELDENKIQQVVMNFSDNAIYYSKEKGKITITLKKTPGWVELLVQDQGIGVPQEEQAHLFNKFFRATNAKRARPDGTGVGLFLAKKVIDEHDGEIIFKSTEGRGSTFGFRLPLPKQK
jgi:signal transduction histidine kinase